MCLLRGSELIVAVQEERLTRNKRDRIWGAAPSLSLPYCLANAGIAASDLDLVVFSTPFSSRDPRQDLTLHPQLRDTPKVVVSHHLTHAFSAAATSGFEETALLVVDGAGSTSDDLSDEERRTVVGACADGVEGYSLYSMSSDAVLPLEKQLQPLERVLPPREGMSMFGSLGHMYAAVAGQIFGDTTEAGKVMGLAPYGKPTIPAADFFDITDAGFVFHPTVPERFDDHIRWPARQAEYRDLAASVQAALEVGLLHLVGKLRSRVRSTNLCYAGGVALNSVANELIRLRGGFSDLYVVPAAEDSGPAIGAAYYGLWQLTGKLHTRRLRRDSLGANYSRVEIAASIERTPEIERVEHDDLDDAVARRLEDGDVVGWFDGGSELGPRSLGQRALLCDPRGADAKDRLNRRVKHREAFRPFAPVVLREYVHEWFELPAGSESPFMLRVCTFRPDKAPLVPAVVHVDGTGRLQTVTREDNPRMHRLIETFLRRTGVPMLLNTSFNVAGEPIVETPDDALWCMLYTGVSCCVLGDILVTKRAGYQGILDLVPQVSATGVTIATRVDEGTFGDLVRDDSEVRCSIVTPWGPLEQRIAPALLRVLTAIDGSSDGHRLLDALRADDPDLDDASLTKYLGLLRRQRIIHFKSSAA